jgi:cobalt/nickel transport system ATP-binding protein
VLPLFLLAAGHVKDDVPEALAAARVAFPSVRFQAARVIGVVNGLVDLALARLAELVALRGADAVRTALLGVGRGSSDFDANGDLCKLVRILGERGGFARAEPCFIAVTRPLAPPALEDLAAVHDGPIVVWPFFLFDGLLVRQLEREVAEFRARHPGRDVRLAAHLGPDDRLLALLDERLAGVLGATAALPCDACPRAMNG